MFIPVKKLALSAQSDLARCSSAVLLLNLSSLLISHLV